MRIVTLLGAIAILACLFVGAQGAEERPSEGRITFPPVIVSVNLGVDKKLLATLNNLPNQVEQIRFLERMLPPKDAPNLELSTSQRDAIYLLALTHSPVAAQIIIDHWDFHDERGRGWLPVYHALRLLGEPAVEPLLMELQHESIRNGSIAEIIKSLSENSRGS
jgi:hypothetical protein